MKALDIIIELKKYSVLPRLKDRQLSLSGKTNTLPQELLKLVQFNKQEIITFLSEARSEPETSIKPIRQAEYYDLTNTQRQIWALSQFKGGSEAYNIADSFIAKGTIDFPLLEKSFNLSVKRHEILRTYFLNKNGEPFQKIAEDLTIKLELESKPGLSLSDIKDEKKSFYKSSFNLAKLPLFKVKIVSLSSDKHLLLFNMHHIISDGWSLGILLQEVMNNYKSLCLNKIEEKKTLAFQFKDYAGWLCSKLKGKFGNDAKLYWNSKNLSDIEPINLPIDFSRPNDNSFAGASQKFYFAPEIHDKLIELSRGHSTTMFNVYRSIVSILLHKWTSQSRIVIGTPVAGRTHSQLANQIGLYVNTLPLVSEFDRKISYSQYLKEIVEDSINTFRFQEYPLEMLIEDNEIKRVSSRSPLFDVLMVVQNTELGDGTIDIKNQYGFTLNEVDAFFKEDPTEKNDVLSKFDLSLNFAKDNNDSHFVEIEFKTALFEKRTIQLFYQMFESVVRQIHEAPDTLLGAIEISNEEEKEKILFEYNKPIEDVRHENILEILLSNVRLGNKKCAVSDATNNYSFEELEKLSNDCAEALRSLESKRIGLFLSRTGKIISSMLGIWKSGKVYVPIDMKYPVGRIQYIIDDAEIEVLLVDSASLKSVPDSFSGTTVNVDNIEKATGKAVTNWEINKNKNDVAYLIYTSGSTGQPKGIEITHRNLVAFIKWCEKEFARTPYDTMFAVTSHCFDLSVFELIFPLSSEKRIRVLESGVSISDFLESEQNIFLNTVPSVVRSLISENISWNNIVALNMAGEPVPKVLRDKLDYKRIEVRNLYGPSEDTTYSTVYRFANDGLNHIPIGVPVTDTHLYILDDDMNILPIGVEGEIYLSGQSVAKGYLNNQYLTNKNFIENPFFSGQRMYRTGDIGKWTKDGLVTFVGRKDSQVKIRGFRVELGEIQYQLDCIDSIEQAVVLVRDVNSEEAIIAYYKPSGNISVDSIKEQLAKHLPAYMIPSYFVEMAAIPMNSNGKVDKRQLPEPGLTKVKEIIKPKTDTQLRLLKLWEHSLNTNGFGIEANFFELGGHSLKATKLRGLILAEFQKEITLNELFERPEILQMAELIDSKPVYIERKIERIKLDSESWAPLSYAQERMWVLTKFKNGSRAYHMPAVFKVIGNLNNKILEAALLNVVKRHESLRTLFRERNGKAHQYIISVSQLDFKLENIELAEYKNLEKFLQDHWSVPFDLEHGPLLRCAVIQHGKDQFISFNMHHIISDGWSIGVLFQDVMKSYSLLLSGDSGTLADLDFQYKDFSAWQHQELSRECRIEQLDYWKKEVCVNEVQPLELPHDHLRPAVKTYNGATILRVLSKSLSDSIVEQSIEQGVSVYMSIMANIGILLKKLSNQSDFIIGTLTSGRDSKQLQDQIGFYVNTLPIRIQAKGNLTYQMLVNDVRKNLLTAFNYQYFPFEMLVNEMQAHRDISRSPLFDVMVVMQNFDVFENYDLQLDRELKLEKVEVDAGSTKYDLTFSFSQQENRIHLELEYNTDLFKATTINKIIDQMEHVFIQTTANVVVPISDISLISASERDVLLENSDMTQVKYDTSQTIISHFEEAVSKFGDHEALRVNNKSWTYKELDKKSGQLASVLVKKYQVKDEDLIILHTSRNEWMVIAILACLKAGAAYVPVDPAYPTSRIEYILHDSEAKLVLADSLVPDNKSHLFKNKVWVNISSMSYEGELFKKSLDPKQLAYMIYTSGTTGAPKGVMIEHRNVSRLLFNESNLFDFNENDSWALFHSYCFDVSVWEMYGALLKGGRLVIVSKEIAQNSEEFFHFLNEEKITVLNQTPTAFKSLCLNNNKKFAATAINVRYLILAGEKLIPSTLKAWYENYPSCRLINMYGITETTVHVTYKEISSKEITENKSNIGAPIPTASCYVLDSDLQPCAPGVIGELCVGGAGVARGYYNRPELTTEKFVENKFAGMGRLYRSGDFARLLNNGEIEYIGRKDEQVKIRGHRIELPEVEKGVKELQCVEEAVVLAEKNTDEEFELTVYYVLLEDVNQVNLRQKLIDKLPSYMIPAHYIQLKEFPMTSNGKLDKKSLPKASSQLGVPSKYIAAENDIQKTLIDIWEEVLGKINIGIRDNFFDLGGHSLKATRMISRIQEIYGVKIDLESLFIDPTIESLAKHISTLTWMLETETATSSGEELII